MFHTVFIRTSARLAETLGGVALFVVSESAFIWSVHQLGPGLTMLLFGTVYSLIALWLFAWFRRAATATTPLGRFAQWTERKATVLQTRYRRLIATSSALAILTAAILAGAFVTAIFISLLGYHGRRGHVYVVAQTLWSVAVWTSFYAGGLRLVLGH